MVALILVRPSSLPANAPFETPTLFRRHVSRQTLTQPESLAFLSAILVQTRRTSTRLFHDVPPLFSSQLTRDPDAPSGYPGQSTPTRSSHREYPLVPITAHVPTDPPFRFSSPTSCALAPLPLFHVPPDKQTQHPKRHLARVRRRERASRTPRHLPPLRTSLGPLDHLGRTRYGCPGAFA